MNSATVAFSDGSGVSAYNAQASPNRLDFVANVKGLGRDGLPDSANESLRVRLAALNFLLGLGSRSFDTRKSACAQRFTHELDDLRGAPALDHDSWHALPGRPEHALHRCRVNKCAHVGVLEESGRHKLDVLVDGLEGRLAPNAEPAKSSSGRKLEEVEPLDGSDLHTRNVPERPPAFYGRGPENNKRSYGPLLAAIPGVSPDLANPLQFSSKADGLQELYGILGLVQLLNGVVHHHRHLT
ncbi:multidrug resistance protein, putative [Babesia ovata]|uniref:Multidrug resistance protein, putative n=1 Tax=Babesia ovata TaxID=189622 RepID=A0A2H6KCN4_9APIC|nr:multidrug resistance protein, putative [Babesia ovata]GBE60719.1 multidrug resistance protein, putative [Babesia ovata]